MRNVAIVFYPLSFIFSLILAGEPVKAENFTLPDITA